MKNVIDRFHDKNNSLTRDVKVPVKRHKKRWLDWIPQLRERYVEIPRKDKKPVASSFLVTFPNLNGHLG